VLRGRLRVPRLETVRFREWLFSLKAGPAKGQALFNWPTDLSNLTETLIQDLSRIGGEVFQTNLEKLRANLPAIARVFPVKEGPLRRLVGIADMEGKTRVIAIVDYFSQNALYPLHEFLFRILRQIPQDVTFSQGSFGDQVKQ